MNEVNLTPKECYWVFNLCLTNPTTAKVSVRIYRRLPWIPAGRVVLRQWKFVIFHVKISVPFSDKNYTWSFRYSLSLSVFVSIILDHKFILTVVASSCLFHDHVFILVVLMNFLSFFSFFHICWLWILTVLSTTCYIFYLIYSHINFSFSLSTASLFFVSLLTVQFKLVLQL